MKNTYELRLWLFEREWRKVATLNVAGKLQFSLNVPLSSFWATKVENITQKEKCEKLVCCPQMQKRRIPSIYSHSEWKREFSGKIKITFIDSNKKNWNSEMYTYQKWPDTELLFKPYSQPSDNTGILCVGFYGLNCCCWDKTAFDSYFGMHFKLNLCYYSCHHFMISMILHW